MASASLAARRRREGLDRPPCRRPVPGELSRRPGPRREPGLVGECAGEALVECFAFARKEGLVDRLREQRVAEPKRGLGRRSGDQISSSTAARSDSRRPPLGGRRGRGEQAVGRVVAGRRRDAQHDRARRVEPCNPAQQRVAEKAGSAGVASSRRCEELLREEGIALGPRVY